MESSLFDKPIRVLTFLLIEPNAALRRYLKQTLKDLGVGSILESESTQDASMILKTPTPIGVVICAAGTRDGNGLKLIQQLGQSKRHQETTILYTSTDDRKELVQAALSVGVDCYLVKPFAFDSLKAQVEQAVHTRARRLALKNLKIKADIPVKLMVDNHSAEGRCLELSRQDALLLFEGNCGFGSQFQIQFPLTDEGEWGESIAAGASSAKKGEQGGSLARVDFQIAPTRKHGIIQLLQKYMELS